MNGDADSLALQRFALLRPHLEDGVSLTVVARTTSVSLVTLRRWARSYHAEGIAGLRRKGRRDVGSRRSIDEQTTALVQGLALLVPRQSIANIHREVHALIERDGGKPPSYNTVRAIVKAIEPAMTTLAHHGSKTYADRFDLLIAEKLRAQTLSGKPIIRNSTSSCSTSIKPRSTLAHGGHRRLQSSDCRLSAFHHSAERTSDGLGTARCDLAQDRSSLASLRHS